MLWVPNIVCMRIYVLETVFKTGKQLFSLISQFKKYRYIFMFTFTKHLLSYHHTIHNELTFITKHLQKCYNQIMYKKRSPSRADGAR